MFSDHVIIPTLSHMIILSDFSLSRYIAVDDARRLLITSLVTTLLTHILYALSCPSMIHARVSQFYTADSNLFWLLIACFQRTLLYITKRCCAFLSL